MPVIQDDPTAPKPHPGKLSSTLMDLLGLNGAKPHNDGPLPPEIIGGTPDLAQPADVTGLPAVLQQVKPSQPTKPNDPLGLLSDAVTQPVRTAQKEQPDEEYLGEQYQKSFIHRDTNKDRLAVEEYNNLTPAQRAAVDFNTMLANAVHRDHVDAKTGNNDPHDPANAAYRRGYGRVFGPYGEDVAAKNSRPQTLALFEQLGYSNPNANIENFAEGLGGAISQQDINRWLTKDPETGHLPDATGNDRGTRVQELSLETRRLEEALAKGNKMLGNITQSAAVDRSAAVEQFGGHAIVDPASAAAANTKAGDFSLYYNALLDSKTVDTAVKNLPAFLQNIRDRYGATPEDFYSYAGNRAETADPDVKAALNKSLGLERVTP